MVNFIQNLSDVQLPFPPRVRCYIDFGTEETSIAVKQKGVVLREPTYIAYQQKIKEYIFYGSEAKTILGKTPDYIIIKRPVVNGILSDFDSAVALLSHLIEKALKPYAKRTLFIKPIIDVVSIVPSIATEIEQKAMEEALVKAGCSRVLIIERPLATVAGCGFDIFSHIPHLVADLGAGILEISVVSGGGVVLQKTTKNAGVHMNKLVNHYLYLKHGIILGEQSGEQLKVELLRFNSEEDTVTTVRGKSLENGLPKTIKVKSSDIREALLPQFNHIIDLIKEIIEIAPPEISDDIFTGGITLTGGLSSIPGIEEFFKKELHIETQTSEQLRHATIHGLIALDRKPELLGKLRIITG